MSETRDIRLLALWRDDPTEAPMTLDLRIDARGGVVSTWDVFGAFDLDGAHCRPFVLRRDGTIDFGAASREPVAHESARGRHSRERAFHRALERRRQRRL